jgi:predicted metal-dependent hydrolase
MNTKMNQLILGTITIEVLQKNIKNLHLSVHPPTGKVRISAPNRMSLDTIRVYAISKLRWIRKHQTKFRNQVRETPREFITNESHMFNGKRYLLRVFEHNVPPKVVLKHSMIELYVRPNTSLAKRRVIIEEWYREKLKQTIPTLIERWENVMNVNVNQFGIKKMKTKWGTCNRQAKRIWFNLELAKKPEHCLEYIVVHELTHLLERKHDYKFTALMDKFMPQWRFYKEELNRLPVRHIDWNY